ncbi:MAG: 50S ribosomal protein L10 [Bacteroidota bacterium]|nr:50S ribosomal protein L10 [Bacteroidota bacterium]
MKKEDKDQIIESLVEKIDAYKNFYLADISELNAEDTTALRRKCFEKEIKLEVVKNTLLRKALERSSGDYEELYDVLKNPTSIMFTEAANVPAKLIKDFRKTHKKPVLKAAYVEESVYVGENQLDALVNIKSKYELIGDVIGMLQSPAKNVISALQSGGGTIAGIVKTLSEKE